MSKRLMIGIAILAVLLLLAIAWFDGGREEQRLIEQPVDLPEINS